MSAHPTGLLVPDPLTATRTLGITGRLLGCRSALIDADEAKRISSPHRQKGRASRGHVMLTYSSHGDATAREWSQREGEPLDSIAVLGRLFIAPEARGDRLGARLTDSATEIACKLGRRAVLDVMAKDKAAIRTYEKLGWERIADVLHTFGDCQTVPAYAYVSPLE